MTASLSSLSSLGQKRQRNREGEGQKSERREGGRKRDRETVRAGLCQGVEL